MDIKKLSAIIVLIFCFVLLVIYNSFFNNHAELKVENAISPTQIVFQNGEVFTIKGFTFFDAAYTRENKELAKQLKLTEDEAFILGNLGRYWANNVLKGRNVYTKNNDIIYYKFGYKSKLQNSSFCIKEGVPTNKAAFEREVNTVKHGNFLLLDLDTDSVYEVSKENSEKFKNYIVVRKNHIKHLLKSEKKKQKEIVQVEKYKNIFSENNIKIILSDSTSKIVPDRGCSSDICKEIVANINNATATIDMAIYGYSSTPAIEDAFKNAVKRGVKIRMVYDTDSKGENIYPDTVHFTQVIADNKNDINSDEAKYTMHNKFFIFDDKILITGSANLSHTDMSGYNSNAIIVIKSQEIAALYKQEFEQMYHGYFHNKKNFITKTEIENIKVFFSPKDKTIENGILPIIKNAQKYIYIPAFVITDKNFSQELINAHKRGVDVRIIADALNASTKNSKHKDLRAAGIPVKAENYAGKMHSKCILADDSYLIIGSMNFSHSGNNKNDENVIVLKNSSAVKFYKDFFIYQWKRIPDKWLKYTPRAEGKDSVGSCFDGIDNNYDGMTDSNDPACNK